MKNSLRKSFGLKLRELRLDSGMSQEEFADRCGFARSYMSRIERGSANPSLDAIEIVAGALEIGVDELFGSMAIPSQRGIVVPFASDGTCFSPNLRRSGKYAVGDKSSTKYFARFGPALSYLASMKTAKWRRPNEDGKWGLVSATRWAPLPSQYYESIAAVSESLPPDQSRTVGIPVQRS